MYKTTLSLYSPRGQRKYLNAIERERFFVSTQDLRIDIRLFCQLLYFTGARIQEVHNLTPTHIDFSNHNVVFETLKRRKRGVFREIPLPTPLLQELDVFIHSRGGHKNGHACLWEFSLRTASRHVKQVMNTARITGLQSTAKGLRHGFAVHAISIAPITLVKKWLGHARLETTEIYLSISNTEERNIAKRLWTSFAKNRQDCGER